MEVEAAAARDDARHPPAASACIKWWDRGDYLVIVSAFPPGPSIGNAHFKRPLETKRYHCIAWNPDGPAACLASIDRTYDRPDQAVVMPGFKTIHVCSQTITLA